MPEDGNAIRHHASNHLVLGPAGRLVRANEQIDQPRESSDDVSAVKSRKKKHKPGVCIAGKNYPGMQYREPGANLPSQKKHPQNGRPQRPAEERPLIVCLEPPPRLLKQSTACDQDRSSCPKNVRDAESAPPDTTIGAHNENRDHRPEGHRNGRQDHRDRKNRERIQIAFARSWFDERWHFIYYDLSCRSGRLVANVFKS